MLLRIIILTDCCDANARVRQELRYAALFPNAQISILEAKSPIEVSGNIVDALDAARINPDLKIIFVGNIAPRSDKKHKNGAPFCYSRLSNNILVVGTAPTFVLLKKFKFAKTVFETDVQAVCEYFRSDIEKTDSVERITHTQFRSLEYVPRLVRWLWSKRNVPSTLIEIDEDEFDGKIWLSDIFKNLKIVSTSAHIEKVKTEEQIVINGEVYKFYLRLADVPKDEIGIIIGSSGYRNGEDFRWLELAKQGGEAGTALKLGVGDVVFS